MLIMSPACRTKDKSSRERIGSGSSEWKLHCWSSTELLIEAKKRISLSIDRVEVPLSEQEKTVIPSDARNLHLVFVGARSNCFN